MGLPSHLGDSTNGLPLTVDTIHTRPSRRPFLGVIRPPAV